MSLLSLQDIKVGYGATTVLEKLNLSVNPGELLSLLGPSGCGKTTTLRAIAGFVPIREGRFVFDGKDYTRIPVHKRNFGFVFQNYALFPHLNVADNVAFGLNLRKLESAVIRRRVAEILEVVGLSDYEKRLPRELSGGQKQRVALARALVINPDLLLFDEPLSNLDAKLRVKMRVEIKKIQQALGVTSVYVTHDQEECFSISDKVAVMNEGVIEQLDSPERIYRRPATEFVARFVGFENFIELHFEKMNGERGIYVAPSGHRFEVASQKCGEFSRFCQGALRPEDITILAGGELQKSNTLEGTVGISTFLGKSYQYVIDTPLGPLTVNGDAETRRHPGECVVLYLPKEKLILV